MRTIILDEVERIETYGHSSKGNQLKWKEGEYWYKADYMGYEGLAEILISRLLDDSNISEFVRYEPARIKYRGKEYAGCRSRNFLHEDEELVTVEKLFRQYTGRSLATKLSRIRDVADRMVYVVENMRRFTGIDSFGKYLSVMLTMDAFFLNEDRHTNNIAVLYNSKTNQYSLCPYFDNGLTLFSDTRVDFSMNKSVEECRKCIEAKPFSRDFDEQLDEAEKLYGQHVEFYFTMKDVLEELNKLKSLYSEDEIMRVEQIMRMQIRKYRYLMK